eukprot:4042925-Prymnesium_polylepis.1
MRSSIEAVRLPSVEACTTTEEGMRAAGATQRTCGTITTKRRRRRAKEVDDAEGGLQGEKGRAREAAAGAGAGAGVGALGRAWEGGEGCEKARRARWAALAWSSGAGATLDS